MLRGFRPNVSDAERLARHVERYPDAVNILFYRPLVYAGMGYGITEEIARLYGERFEEEQRRRVRDYVRARRALINEIDVDAFQRGWEELINDPGAVCPECGAQPMQMHKEDCPQRGRDVPPRRKTLES